MKYNIYLRNPMKKCFSQLIERFTWDDEDAYVLSQKQRECMQCSQFQKCYALSIGKTLGRILLQLELLHEDSDEDDGGNGNSEILGIEDS